MSIITLNICEKTKQWHIHGLLDVVNNPTKFQLNQIGTYNFQLKLFDTAVTLKYNQGHWKWQGWVKLNEYYHHAKSFYVYHIYSFQENHNI